MVCDFLKPALIDDLLEVETRFGEFAGARMELTQTVMRADEKLFEAQVTVALVDGQGKPKRLPPEIQKHLFPVWNQSSNRNLTIKPSFGVGLAAAGPALRPILREKLANRRSLDRFNLFQGAPKRGMGFRDGFRGSWEVAWIQ